MTKEKGVAGRAFKLTPPPPPRVANVIKQRRLHLQQSSEALILKALLSDPNPDPRDRR